MSDRGNSERSRSRERQRVERNTESFGSDEPATRWRSQPPECSQPPGAPYLRRPSAWRIVMAALALAVVGFLALRTSPYLQYIPWMPRRVGVWADSNGILRNVVAFFALGGVVFLLVGRGWRVAVAVGAFATGVEVAQRWIPGRVFDWRDIAASLVGVVLAWMVVWPWRRRSRGS